jgi:hypothetical protein
MVTLEQFNLRRGLADGMSGRRIKPTTDFEGGHIDFDASVNPGQGNWITLQLWEAHSELMTERNGRIALEVFADDPDRNREWYLPEYMSEEQRRHYEWYGLKPEPGRWVYASYRLPDHVTDGQDQLRLRLKGIGNEDRDYPMRVPAPPIYRVINSTRPIIQLPGKEQ